MRVNDAFCAVSFSGATRSAKSVPLEEAAFSRQRKLLICGRQHGPCSRTSNRCLSTFCDTRGSKVPKVARHNLVTRAQLLQPPHRCRQRHLLDAEAMGGHFFNGE